jgi:hypothetical protein
VSALTDTVPPEEIEPVIAFESCMAYNREFGAAILPEYPINRLTNPARGTSAGVNEFTVFAARCNIIIQWFLLSVKSVGDVPANVIVEQLLHDTEPPISILSTFLYIITALCRGALAANDGNVSALDDAILIAKNVEGLDVEDTTTQPVPADNTGADDAVLSPYKIIKSPVWWVGNVGDPDGLCALPTNCMLYDGTMVNCPLLSNVEPLDPLGPTNPVTKSATDAVCVEITLAVIA